LIRAVYLHNIFIIPSIALHIHLVFFNIRKEVEMIRKGVIAGLTLLAALVLVSAVYAHFPGGGFGTCLSWFNNTKLI